MQSSISHHYFPDRIRRCVSFRVRGVDGTVREGGKWRIPNGQEGQIIFFAARMQKDDAETFSAGAAGATAAVEEYFGVLGCVELQD